MDKALKERIVKYLNHRYPLGPYDAHLIKDARVATHLFDPHNSSFNSLLTKDVSVVVGRRGSGKTALLNSYLYRRYFSEKAPAPTGTNTDFYDYDLVTPILGHKVFEHMQSKVVGPHGLLRPIESVIEDWAEVIIDFIIISILKHPLLTPLGQDEHLSILEVYVSAPETRKKIEAYRIVWGQNFVEAIRLILGRRAQIIEELPNRETALQACISFLRKKKMRAVFICDSLDNYQAGKPEVDRIIGALLRFVGQFNTEHQRIQIKIGLPSEIFPEIQRSSANPLKDFANFDLVKWTSIELGRIAAYRYRLFLQIFDNELYPKVATIDLNQRNGASRFWRLFFTEEQVNRYGAVESAMTYMLRHTQLIPRQLLSILTNAIIGSYNKTGGYRFLTSENVTNSIEQMEPIIAGEIFQAFNDVYPYAEGLGRATFANFPTVLSYNQLEDRWRKIGRAMMRSRGNMFEMVDFTEMLLRMGIIGVVEAETNRYVVARFAYNVLMPPAVGEKLTFAIHPIFSRIFSCSPNAQKKSILPLGAELE